MRKLVCGLVFVAVASVVNIAWAQGPGVIDPVRPVSVQVYLCTFNEGKTIADLNGLQQRWVSAMEESNYNGLTFQLTPRYVSGAFDIIWLDYLPFDQLAESQEWFDTNAQDVNTDYLEIVSCQVSLNTNRLRYANEPLPEDGTGFFLWDWCTLREGVTGAAVAARRNEFVQGLSDAGARGAWSVMFPFMGMRTANRPGQFAHMSLLPDWSTLASIHEYDATGGWRNRIDFNENVAECIGPNVYDVTVLNRPRTPWSE